ncbi:MAG: hypothetical protein US86_C0001G0182 [Candidatus Daviesbacteria bacterium GW2011_GWA2_38_24]|uniref:Transketolase-like pyrimidine-binding domain-containing protein n=1 Tax=Candidatus Daviesbacteria bacterium GW2011_GWA2_38_24 TaxID=1618422 RepID=A0A0G0JVW4_9BACT|nr:MAG: hypothetical protein US86_C0001G0182 [Candidatus Daviesbacteria bacterium GW2011_GWA2_38_24]KKQ79170.1 MAG: hypothetical protein UT01_C0049G0007 [Candidatus Daviesbacteria bacterium GW2011_GWA1_38_7]OGE23164.1 MAG: hypothetical protein A2688_00210 [Candidatus Daviesbacteria bacterium RIFCSPHIGHO2_01_FULL_38_8]
MNTLSPNLRRAFADILLEHMKTNDKIYVVTGDFGYKMWDQIRDEFPDRFINVGAAEQLMMGVGVGLALEGKIPFVYTVTSFLLYRPFETIRNYINYEKIPVKLIGSGRDKDYFHDGFSHWAEEDKEIMKIFSNIKPFWPESSEDLPKIIEEILDNGAPSYVNLRRTK